MSQAETAHPAEPGARGERGTLRRVRLLATLAVLCGIGVYYVVRHGEQFSGILRVGAVQVVAMLALTLISGTVYATVLRTAANHLGTRLSLGESVAMFWATAYANFLPMKAGLALQGVYLKRNHELPYSRFASYTAGVYVILFLAIGVAGMGLSVPSVLRGECGLLVPAGFAALALACLVPILVPAAGRYAGGSRALGALSRVVQGWHELRSDRGMLLKITVVSAASILLQSLRLVVAYRALGYDTPWNAVLLVALAGGFVELLSVVPGGLVLREAAIGGMGVAVGNAFGVGVVAGTLDRAASMVVIFVLGPLAVHHLLGRTSPEQNPGAGVMQAVQDHTRGQQP